MTLTLLEILGTKIRKSPHWASENGEREENVAGRIFQSALAQTQLSKKGRMWSFLKRLLSFLAPEKHQKIDQKGDFFKGSLISDCLLVFKEKNNFKAQNFFLEEGHLHGQNLEPGSSPIFLSPDTCLRVRQAERKVILPRMEEGEAESPPLGKEKTKSWLTKILWERDHDRRSRSWSHLLEGLAFYRDLRASFSTCRWLVQDEMEATLQTDSWGKTSESHFVK